MSDFATATAAIAGGADRIELCANLQEGGTTATYGTLSSCRELADLPMYPIIRPRGGDFVYSDEEYQIMYKDLAVCRDLGFDGIVIGMLNRNGLLDYDRCARLVEKAYPMGVTFHRAFDRCADPFEALEQIIQMGCERLLTSGQQLYAMQGKELIRALQKQSEGRLIIMPGSAVRADNIEELAIFTGCQEFHTSLRTTIKSTSTYFQPAFEADAESYQNNAIDPEAVKKIKSVLQQLAAKTDQ